MQSPIKEVPNVPAASSRGCLGAGGVALLLALACGVAAILPGQSDPWAPLAIMLGAAAVIGLAMGFSLRYREDARGRGTNCPLELPGGGRGPRAAGGRARRGAWRLRGRVYTRWSRKRRCAAIELDETPPATLTFHYFRPDSGLKVRRAERLEIPVPQESLGEARRARIAVRRSGTGGAPAAGSTSPDE